MGSPAVSALSVLFVELEDITKLLDEYERTRSNKAINQAAVKIKASAPKLKEYSSDPAFKTSETAPLLSEAKQGFKNAFNRAKALKSGGKGGKEDEEEEAPTEQKNTIEERNQGQRNNDLGNYEKNAEKNEDIERNVERKIQEESASIKERNEEKKRAEELEEMELRKKELIEMNERAARRKAQRQLQEGPQIAPGDVVIEASKEREHNYEDSETRDEEYLEKRKGKDIWSLILKEQKEKDSASNPSNSTISCDFTAIFVGSKNSGKSTLIGRLIDKQGDPKASTSLEYSYGRRPKTTSVSKDIVHTWELAGGTSMSQLFDVCLSSRSLLYDSTVVIVITLDLSEPSRVLDTAIKWVDIIRARVDACIKELEKSNPSNVQTFRKNYSLYSSLPSEHQDKDVVKPIGVPVVIVGTKYDLFQDFEAERRKIMCKTLRFIAHSNGTALMYLSTKETKDDSNLMAKYRTMITHYLFHSSSTLQRTPIFDYTKPLFVPFGTDSFEQIGRPPVVTSVAAPSYTKLAGMAMVLAPWRAAFSQCFPSTTSQSLDEDDTGVSEFEIETSKYMEPIIDTVRAEKERELQAQQREMARLRQREVLASTSKKKNVAP
eukprot:TRINITY_DN8821_c0_g1_i1.p1 TRINITY_DN8821_c0_g1~~TRINITY_DN8821_c0_g1_i1.p1  ORF type:complete len:605 (+),score=148.33 TRINITY_DN8821_c0_g1_i1:190-2004(+)